MKLYVQADNTGNMPHHFDAACALYGALDSGVETRLIRMEDLAGINNLAFLNNPFVGSVEFMREIFSRFGKDPRVPDNSNRDEERITIGEAKKRIEAGETLFVKPVHFYIFPYSIRWEGDCPEFGYTIVFRWRPKRESEG